jgi:hypothetical protein
MTCWDRTPMIYHIWGANHQESSVDAAFSRAHGITGVLGFKSQCQYWDARLCRFLGFLFPWDVGSKSGEAASKYASTVLTSRFL